MLDSAFKERMAKLLGDELSDFISAVEDGSAVKGARVNTGKISTENFLNITSLSLSPLSYLNEGYIINSCDGVGNTPEHHAGMIYVQDPGAMSTLSALDIREGWWVLDSCAAPGGKSTQAAAKIGNSGFILSNEFVAKRAKTVVSNFERLGIKNGLVTSLDTAELPKMFRAIFDLVIADVPCSGEGMFRKSEDALEMWSEENVLLCSRRQSEILENLAGLVKAGGYLLYSTCTYSLEENEAVIDKFLEKHTDYKQIPVKNELINVTRPGISFEGATTSSLELSRRFYPHISAGEGQFIALLQRNDDIEDARAILYKENVKQPTREELTAVKNFFKENLKSEPCGRIIKYSDNLVLVSHDCPIPTHSVFSAGVLLGEVKKGLLFPSHQFFSSYGGLFKRQENLTRGSSEIQKYLRGEEIDTSCGESGWCAVLYEGAALGGGKMSGGKIKNHYPKGLRTKG